MNLKPCPFCGREAFIWETSFGTKIGCVGDCITMPSRWDTGFTSKEKAIEDWNKRPIEDNLERKIQKMLLDGWGYG